MIYRCSQIWIFQL